MIIQSLTLRRWILVAVVWLLAATPALAAVPDGANTPSDPDAKIGSNLELLLSMLENDIPADPASSLGQELARIRESGMVRVNARFNHELSRAERAEIEGLGVEFQEAAGVPANLGPFYDLLVPVGAVYDLAALEITIWLEAAWQPDAPPTAPFQAESKIASTLGMLLSMLQEGIPYDPDSELGKELDAIKISTMIRVNARFEHELSDDDLARLDELGIGFQQVNNELAQLGPFYDLVVPVDRVDDLAALEFTLWLESAWQLGELAPLDRSITDDPANYTYVNAPGVWAMTSPAVPLVPLTGEGVTIANFDTGVDVHHPAFLKGSYGVMHTNWDTSGDGTFTPGTDQIGGVKLRFWSAIGAPGNNPASFDVTEDWVYGDANDNGSYEWNEMIYMAGDVDGDNVLEAGEPLVERGTLDSGIANSKIRATLNTGNTQRTRATDLELTTADTNGHGTSVTGILGAGNAHWFTLPAWPYTRRYTGVAPDADLLVADRLNTTFGSYIPWAAFSGARVMLYEYGGWIQRYMDGSSNLEQMMDLASSLGILQVVPVGNLHCAGAFGCNPRHLRFSLPASSTFHEQFNVPVAYSNVYISMLWLTPGNNLQVRITTPTGGAGNSPLLVCSTAASGWQWTTTADNHWVGCERAADSPRGTALYNIQISPVAASGVKPGNWDMAVTNNASSAELASFYIYDSGATWSGGAGWLNTSGGGQEIHTATSPSTCDSCLGVASYATRANFAGTIGDLSYFSGRGPRFLDGARIVDVAAPGHHDVVTPASKDDIPSVGSYKSTFGGTSAAGPHVAGMAALLYQYAANITTSSHVAWSIMNSAKADQFTGTVPNNNWGYGKLAGPGALENMMIHELGDAPTGFNTTGQPMDAYPGVAASFPTVYSTTVPGPVHWWAGSLGSGVWDTCLGTAVSSEREADSLFDEDATNNIQPASNKADLDQADDGLPFPGALRHCTATTVRIKGTFTDTNQIVPPPWPRYVNVWADWNADGDWGDTFTCTAADDASEWVLKDHLLSISAAGPFNVSVPVLPHRGGNGGDPLWIRVTVSEAAAPLDPGTNRADGRGPDLGYLVGETEDYLYPQTDFEASSPKCGEPMAFTHAPTSSWPVNFTWDFGDGTVVTDPGPNPTHAYATAGDYTVTLTGKYGTSTFSTYSQVVQAKPCSLYLPIVLRNQL